MAPSDIALVEFVQKAVILWRDTLLLVRKGAEDPNFPHHWDLPGGRMERNESPDEHIRREVWEETGLTVRPLRPLAVWSWTNPGSAGGAAVVAMARECGLEDVGQGPPAVSAANQTASDAIRSCSWVALRTIAGLRLMPDGREPILRALGVL